MCWSPQPAVFRDVLNQVLVHGEEHEMNRMRNKLREEPSKCGVQLVEDAAEVRRNIVRG